ncbi:MAG: DinB family protein, partial [Gammaproteobacteria bacterium]|nr:DinB family protein [Gammaproteobacteria bacterium]
MEAQHRVRSVIENLNDFDYRSQFHHELSALGWHLGHCLYIENYWLHEVLSADDSLTKGLDQLYIPEKSYKPERGGKLPELKQLISMAVEYQKNNVQLLNNITTNSAKRYLLKDAYLQNFILQHYDQHYESMQMALQQRALKESYSGYRVTSPLRAQQPVENTIHIKQSEQTIGSDHVTSYDNERP